MQMSFKKCLPFLLIATSSIFAGNTVQCAPQCPKEYIGPYGQSLDVGIQYAWFAFTSPPDFTGSTIGAMARVTYQVPDQLFGQMRFAYNNGSLWSTQATSRNTDTYFDFLGGYCFNLNSQWTVTPYIGLGFDFITDNKAAYTDGITQVPAIKLHYQTDYAVAGFETRYSWCKWSIAGQFEWLPSFNQYLTISTLDGSAWNMHWNSNYAIRIPVSYKISKCVWLEVAPFYRYFAIGSSDVLGLPERNMNQVGAFAALRFFL
ncbi:MAG: hypothetical protein WCN87_03210 [Chlamydiota bacterium]